MEFLKRLCFVMLILFTACERALEMDLPYEGDKLVINGILSPQRVVSVAISRTDPPTGKSHYGDRHVREAKVVLFEDDEMLEELTYDSAGVYASPTGFMPEAGRAYRIEAAFAGMPEAVSENVRIPDASVVDSIVFSPSVPNTMNEGDPAVGFTFWVSQITSVYLNIEVKLIYQGEAHYAEYWLTSGLHDLSPECAFYNGSTSLNAGCFEGNTGIEFTVENMIFTPDTIVNVDTFQVNYRAITEDYYQYLRTSVQVEGFELVFLEPEVLRSNIAGGYGILAGANENIRLFSKE